MTPSLCALLLRRSGAGTLWGRLAKTHFGPGFDSLLQDRILKELRPATDWSVCASCDCGAVVRILVPDQNQYIAFCPADAGRNTRLNADDLRRFEINLPALAGRIAMRSCLVGPAQPPPAEIAPALWLLCRHLDGRLLILATERPPLTESNLVQILRSATQAMPALMVIPDPFDFATTQRLGEAGVATALYDEVFTAVDDGFRICAPAKPNMAAVDPLLVVYRSARQIRYYGHTIKLSPRSFNVFCLLAEAAHAGRGLVPNNVIEQCIAGKASIHLGAAADAIRDIKKKLKPVPLPTGKAGDSQITNRSGMGYQIELAPTLIQFLD